ncbi:MAG: MBL fold metallo-hydrolase [Planctomycetia bacterium]|nr:MBL fold metallo-hydrolase [Planctomycetia bacterium]
MLRLTFHGAAETVTGSKYLLEAQGTSILVDCGLFQGLKELRLKNWAELPFGVGDISAIVLTHAHIDHIGFLPRLTKFGYDAPVYCTPATENLARVMLMDAAKLQESDAAYANRKKFSKHHPALPLFDADDAAQALKLLRPTPRGEWFAVAGPFRCRYHDAGHLLGSSMVEMEAAAGPDSKRPLRLLFSGDVGRYDAPIYHDPAPPPACDYLVCESTYGDRDHPTGDLQEELADSVRTAIRRGGVILVAAFAVGRAQQLIYLLQLLIQQGRIPELPIFLDSPMAVEATNIYCRYSAEHDLSEGKLAGSDCAFRGKNVHLARTVDESKRINNVSGPAVIIASSGMMTGGRILHHLEQRLPGARNTVLLGGFMAEGTRGRTLEDGAAKLRLYGRDVPVRAAIVKNSGLSCHADRGELERWLAPLPAPRRTFITHGEKASAMAFAERLRSGRGWDTWVPRLGQTVALEAPA